MKAGTSGSATAASPWSITTGAARRSFANLMASTGCPTSAARCRVMNRIHCARNGDGPVIDNGKGISGDPQIVRRNDLWVMFYFGHVWKPKAFDTFACSNDLVNWTKWEGPHLVEPSEPWDATFAHKPWMLKHEGVVYHFYCAVGDQGRAIALATSKDVK